MTHDAADNLTHHSDATRTEDYAYDAYGFPVTASINGSMKTTFAYDVLGRRVSQAAGNQQQTLVWDGSQLIAHGASAQTMTIEVPGDDLDDHVASIDKNNPGQRRFLHQGPDKSVFAVTNVAGLVEGYTYSGWGEMTTFINGIASSSSPQSAFGYQGHQYDAVTGNVMMRARMYLPTLGRFASRDPLGLAAGWNMFGFVRGAPLSFRDPLGLEDDDAKRKSVNWMLGLGTGALKAVSPADPGAQFEWHDRDFRIGVGTGEIGAGLVMMAFGAGGTVGGGGVSSSGVGALVGVTLAVRSAYLLGKGAYSTGKGVADLLDAWGDDKVAQSKMNNTMSQAQKPSGPKPCPKSQPPTTPPPLTPAQQKAVNKINNTIKDHLKPGPTGDISGTVRDMLGNPVPKKNGGYWDHMNEMESTLRSLRKNSAVLNGVLDPVAQAARQRALSALNEIENALKGIGL